MLSYDIETVKHVLTRMNRNQAEWVSKHLDLNKIESPLFSLIELEWAGLPSEYVMDFLESDERIPLNVRTEYEKEKAIWFTMSPLKFVNKYHATRARHCYKLLESLLGDALDMPLIVKHIRNVTNMLKLIPERAFEYDYEWSKKGLDALDEYLKGDCDIDTALKRHGLEDSDFYSQFTNKTLINDVTTCHSLSIINLILAISKPDYAPSYIRSAVRFYKSAQNLAMKGAI